MATQTNKYVKGLKTFAQIISAATTVVGAAGKFADAAKPAMETDEGRKAVAAATSKVEGIAGKVAGAKDSAMEARKAKKEEKELAKALKEAQQAVLINASRSIPMSEYLKLRKDSGSAAAIISAGLFDAPGCFAIATYSKFDFDNDLTDYLGVYVGSGENVGRAIDLACSRAGNPDVYADVKYRQNVHLYIYPCCIEELGNKEAALSALLEAEASYNATIEGNED